MRTAIARTLAGASAATALVLSAVSAHAQQVDVNPPMPNVLLLIDNSGSMERMIDGSLPESSPQNACNCDASGKCDFSAQPAPNRWGVMIQALTGSFQNGYNCSAMPRTLGSDFAHEYQIDGVAPYDVNYYIPYHRPIAGDTTIPGNPLACVYAPGALPGAATPHGVGVLGVGANGLSTDFPSGAIVQHTFGPLTPKACAFSQYQDGALDSELDILRFGLMTFDQDPSPATGMTGQSTVASPPFDGMWTYYPGWDTGAACTYVGRPANCATTSPYAVGARNPAAPPWEGRMIRFPATADKLARQTQNDTIQKVLLASRPYGATPLAGMFAGAQYYLESDPTGPGATDTFVQGGCRPQYIILLTDGAPNQDLRPECSQLGSPNGLCPFLPPDATALALSQPPAGKAPVKTYVIGFAVSSFQDPSQGQTVYCSNLIANGQLSAKCSDPTQQGLYGACCELQKIALAGGTTSAFFADTPGALQKALGTILSQIGKNVTTRTTPAFSSVVSNVLADPTAPQTNAALFLASFVAAPGMPWSGNVQRQRSLCTYAGAGYSVKSPAVQASAGDDFAANLNSGVGTRTVVLLQPDLTGAGTVDASATIRPYISATADGVGKYSALTNAGNATSVVAQISPAALKLGATACQYTPTTGGATKQLSATQCRDMVLDYTLGQSFGSNPGDFPFISRVGNAFGDVFHATPAVVGPPAALLRDDSYIGFRSNVTYANRKQVVYVATNDGLLHAFWADETKLENNELWALMPPAVLPNLLTSYPSSHQFLLDGSPVTKDVVWDRPLSNQGDPRAWHTMLVAGFGPSQMGYYAVDVSNPDPRGMSSGAVPPDPPAKGPVFMWQLTKMPGTNAQLFGAHSGTPAITSLFVDPGDGKGAREIGVAILPGGQNSGPASSGGTVAACGRLLPKASDAAPVNAYQARTSVRCWGTPPAPKVPSTTDPVVGRSLSVVRLDTGEILRVFMRKGDLPATDTLKSRVIDTALDSPMTGTPVPYPSEVGADATKVFVGDADGTIWRFDLSSSDPSKWVGELYLDLYNQKVDKNPTSWSDGQPVQLPMVISLDPTGNVVLNAATGSQESFDSTGVYYVYSISEMVVGGASPKLRAEVNWWLDPSTVTPGITKPGERVSGPMTVFDGALYFATYGAPSAGQSCSSGDARLWGRDFVVPEDLADLSKGGAFRLPPPQGPVSPLPPYIQPDTYDASLSGAVIPGVSIRATPACGGLGLPGPDDYVYGTQHESPLDFETPQNQFSLFTNVGASGPTGTNTRSYEVQLPTPVSPTMIDSWAGVLE